MKQEVFDIRRGWIEDRIQNEIGCKIEKQVGFDI
jgi:hypothetical protein